MSKPSVKMATGTFLERKLLANIPGLEDFRRYRDAPDFLYGNLWIEAKVGRDASDFGSRLKRYQFPLHREFAPMLYIIGFHDFERARARLTQPTLEEQVAHLEEEAHITRLYLVSARVVEAIWRGDKYRSKKHGQWYCTLSANALGHIVTDTPIRRRGRYYCAREYYGLRSIVCEPAAPIGRILTKTDHAMVNETGFAINPELFKRD